MEQFTNLYSLSKTLRFELKPIGKTKENIEKNGILERDNQRDIAYKAVKKVIDEYHKSFIEMMLNDFELQYEMLEEYHRLYQISNSEEPEKKEKLQNIQKNLRKQISERFTKSEQYKRLFAKKLIEEDLSEFVKTTQFENYIRTQKGNDLSDEQVRQIQERTMADIDQFKNFTTYFKGFHENRQNMYVADDKASSIAHRMIDENLPKFIDNMKTFAEIAESDVAEHFADIYTAMESYLNVNDIREMFQLDYFSMVLTQKQIDVYNAIIGGKTLADGTKIQGLNEYVNLYNQQQKKKEDRLPKLKPLFKQILSERNAISWLPEEFKDDNEMLQRIEKCYQDLNAQVFGKLKTLLENIKEDYDIDNIYLPNDLQLTDIAQKHYGSWAVINKAIEEDLKTGNPQKNRESGEKYEERIAKLLKANDSYSIGYINSLLKDRMEDFKPLEAYFSNIGAEDDGKQQKLSHFARIENAYTEAKSLLTAEYPDDKRLSQDKANVEKIKNLLDAIKDLQRFVKPLLGCGTESDKDSQFYGDFTPLWETLDQITPLYNMVRNRMTQKPYSQEKIRLNFDKKSFLNGWVDSKTESSDNGTQYGGYLFRKKNNIGEYDYYLGLSAAAKLFRSSNSIEEEDKSDFERLDYYQLKDQTFYGVLYKGDYEKETLSIKQAIDSVVNNFGSDELKEKITKEKAKAKEKSKVSTAKGYLNFVSQADPQLFGKLLNDNAFNESNQAVMTSMRTTLSSLDRIPLAKECTLKKFSLFSEMMADIDVMLQSKIFSYFTISQKEFDEAITRTQKPLYLFKITNKDLSFAEFYENGLRKKRGTDNLHTMYFKALMSGEQSVFDLGSGAVFFRKRSLRVDKPTHPANQPIANKNVKNKRKESTFPYDLIKNRRYTVDKFQFHLSITMNYNVAKPRDINPLVNEYLKNSNATHIIGIDRGERHLLYLSLIDLKGNIVEQYSLNEIVNEYNGNTYRTNYHDLLDAKEKQRDEARRSWQAIENIKELKEGYMSQVIHKIAQLMLKYNAIVVLEDLNFGFMRGRQKVEKNVYQKFEEMLIDKLNYLVDKKRDANELGGVLNALQLTNLYKSFNDQYKKSKHTIGKQCGFLFYIPAWNTSKMDPTTGFVNLLDMHYENMEKAKAFFGKFDSIRYNSPKDWFEFAFDYNNFHNKAEGTRTQWTLCTYGTRIETKRDAAQNNNFVSKEVCLTEQFKKVFDEHQIDINGNLKEQICSQTDASFFKALLNLLRLTLQMRNSITGTETDYLISPVQNANGEFYDSRKCGKNLPENADANGAYNIARKGLWVIEQIKQADDLSNIKLAISNKEWMRFAQKLE